MLTDQTRDLVLRQLTRDEGRKTKPYRDNSSEEGKWTIGVGRNLDDVGVHDDEIDLMLANDLAEAERTCRVLWPTAFDALSPPRQAVLVNMAFNLGLVRLSMFRDLRSAITKQDWLAGAAAMLDSRWARQVGDRAQRLAQQWRTGVEV